MSYLRRPGMRAITSEFEHAYREHKAKKSAGQKSHPLADVPGMTAECFQEALACLNLDDNTALAKVLGVSTDRAGRIRNHPEKLTLPQYHALCQHNEKCLEEADSWWNNEAQVLEYLGGSDEGIKAAAEDIHASRRFYDLLEKKVGAAYDIAAFNELRGRALLTAYGHLTPEHRKAVETILACMVQTDCKSKKERRAAIDALETCSTQAVYSAPARLAELIAQDIEETNHINEKHESVYRITSPVWIEEEQDVYFDEEYGTFEEIQHVLFDEYTSPRDEDMKP